MNANGLCSVLIYSRFSPPNTSQSFRTWCICSTAEKFVEEEAEVWAEMLLPEGSWAIIFMIKILPAGPQGWPSEGLMLGVRCAGNEANCLPLSCCVVQSTTFVPPQDCSQCPDTGQLSLSRTFWRTCGWLRPSHSPSLETKCVYVCA